jgi:hypothetical protein
VVKPKSVENWVRADDLAGLLNIVYPLDILVFLVFFLCLLVYLSSKPVKDRVNALFKVSAALIGFFLDDSCDVATAFFLLFLKLFICGDFNVVGLEVYDSVVFHLFTISPVFQKNWTENIIDSKQLSLKNSLDLFSMLLENIATPHFHMAPRAEIFEEVLASDLAIVSTLRKPFLKGCVLNWREILVQSESIFG